MNVIVTGGYGFIGKRILKCLAGQSIGIVSYDLKTELQKGVSSKQGDIFRKRTLENAFRGRETVIHLVGFANISLAQKYPERSFRINVVSLKNVLEACRACKVKHVVFASSAAVYSQGVALPISETAETEPTTVYGYHKLMCEMLLKAYKKAYDIDYSILRLFNVYGSGNKGILHSCIESAKKKQPIHIVGGNQLRDFVSADDVAQAFLQAIVRKSSRNKIINIGSGRGITIKKMAELVKKICPQLIIEVDRKKNTLHYDSVANIRRAQKILGFKPNVKKSYMCKIIKEWSD